MAFNTSIGWCHHTFNAWIGCAHHGHDCINCYAEQLMDKKLGHVRWGPDGTRLRTGFQNWQKPYRWNELAARHRTRFLVFGNSLNDILEDRPELVQWRAEYCEMIEATKQLTWLLLTKRPENWELLPPAWFPYPPDNVWFGLSAGDQETYDARAGLFVDFFDQFKVEFLSVEPHIGVLELHDWDLEFWDWVVGGGESDQIRPGRPYELDWGRSLIRDCAQAGVPYFHKQMGSDWARKTLHITESSTVFELGDRAGSDPRHWPSDLCVQQFPQEIMPFLGLARGAIKTVERSRHRRRK